MKLLKPTFNELTLLKQYLDTNNSNSCAFDPGNVIFWAELYNTRFSIIDDMLVFFSLEEEIPSAFTFPMKKGGDYLTDILDEEYLSKAKKIFDQLDAYFAENEKKLKLYCITPELFQIIDNWYPGKYKYNQSRDSADYIYTVEKLSTLKGSKLHGKRNHINNFLKNHPNYIYEDLKDGNEHDCLLVAKKWMDSHLSEDEQLNFQHRYEYTIIETALSHRKDLSLRGGILKLEDGTPIAFTIGEPLNKDTFDVHFEKADDSIPGAYPLINREFVKNSLSDYKYVNREEDMGLLGLRKAKLSYVPDILLDIGTVTENKEEF